MPAIGQFRDFESPECRLTNSYQVGTFSCAQMDSLKERNRELATFDESRRAAGVQNPMRDKNGRHAPGGRRDDTWDHILSRSWKVKVTPKTKTKNKNNESVR